MKNTRTRTIIGTTALVLGLFLVSLPSKGLNRDASEGASGTNPLVIKVGPFNFENTKGNELTLKSCDRDYISHIKADWNWDKAPFIDGHIVKEGKDYIWTEVGDSALSRENTQYWWQQPPLPKNMTFPPTVRKIGAHAFAGGWTHCNERIEHLVIPSSVKSIGVHAFSYAFAAEEDPKDPTTWKYTLTIEGGTCDVNAFRGNNYKTVTLSGTAENPVNLRKSQQRMNTDETAFGGAGIYDLKIGPNVYLGEAQFSNMSNFNTISINCDTIPTGCFENSRFYNKATDKRITLGLNIVQIRDHAFNMFSTFPEVHILGKCDFIGEHAFCGCGLKKLQIDGTPTTFMGIGAFELNPEFETAAIYCENIGDQAFAYCGGLKTVIIGPDVKRIGVQAFEQCAKLTDIYLGVEAGPGYVDVPLCKTNAFTSVGRDNGSPYVEQPNWKAEGENPQNDYTSLRLVNVHVTPVGRQGTELVAYIDQEAYDICHEALANTISNCDSQAMLFAIHSILDRDAEIQSLYEDQHVIYRLPNSEQIAPDVPCDQLLLKKDPNIYIYHFEAGEGAYMHQGFDRDFLNAYYCYKNPWDGYDDVPEGEEICNPPTNFKCPTTGAEGTGIPANMGNFNYLQADDSQDSLTDHTYFPEVSKGIDSHGFSTGITALANDDNPLEVRVENGTVILPAGALLFSIAGILTNPESPAPGVYIARRGRQSAKILVR